MKTELSKLPVSALPLVFTYNNPIAGEGYVASVAIRARVLAEIDQDGVTLAGIMPGGVNTNCAQTLREAQADLRDAFTAILIDIAHGSEDFSAFRAEVERFVDETSDELLAAWDHAVNAVRDARVTSMMVGLPAMPSATRAYARVEEIKPGASTVDMNKLDASPALALPHPDAA